MTLVWSWEEMDYIGEEEPRLLPDLWIEAGDICASCGLTEEASGKRLVVECSQCGGVAHFTCAVDCTPDPYEVDEDYNDWVCGACLEWTPEQAAAHAAQILASIPVPVIAPLADPFDPFFDEEAYPLP
ncbi:MAG TPA: hypothetical protein VGD98_09835 [Ktedonobacteraceae bacterium]